MGKMSRVTCANYLRNFAALYHSSRGVYGFRPRIKPVQYVVSDGAFQNRIKNSGLYQLAVAFRDHGHKIASINPILNSEIVNVPELDPSRYGLNVHSHDTVNVEGILNFSEATAKMNALFDSFKTIYCGHIGVEFQYMCEEEREWFAAEFEKLQLESEFRSTEKKELATELIKSQVFDHFLATKFSSVKRYGGEGAESMMGFFLEMFRRAAQSSISDIVIGIPHRGRLNLLTGLLKFPPVAMFQKMKGMPEFPDSVQGTGDVLSHLTSSVDLNFDGKLVHVTMLPNPSHLEAVSPVVVGKARGLLQSLGSRDYSLNDGDPHSATVLPIQVHGDASFTGQGVMMEIIAMSRVPHFDVGGSVHLIVNNQIGFTTPQERGRSSLYCSDLMKMISAPVIHVSGDYPEDVMKASRLALRYRQTFQKDVLVDLICFRQWGHNELDDPTFTNPSMYKTITTRQSVPDTYAESLVEKGVWSKENWAKVIKEYSSFLGEELKQIDFYQPKASHLEKRWKICVQPDKAISVWDTGLPVDLLKFIGMKSVSVPEYIKIHPTLSKHFINERLMKLEKSTNLDWATAEALAVGSLLYQGHNVRISGQDVGRGTFSHRHAMLIDQATEEMYVPLNHMFEAQTAFYEVANSILSEEGVLGFEYGFSIGDPNNLVIWEAQFGDFFNAAQVVFDTCISSGESKWLLQSGIVILLPHGYDGAGPEHSSCRMERFLQMCDSQESDVDGDNVNWYIMNPTLPSQYFHLLRKQIVCNYRKPLIVIAPKILLRHPQAVSSIADMGSGTAFVPVLGDSLINPSKVQKIIFCSGKHYYLLEKERESRQKTDVAIIRLEALCPFPVLEIANELKKYKNVKSFVWSQEEHQNMGPWFFVKTRFKNLLGCKLKYAGRGPSAAPAVGIGQRHHQEIQDMLRRTFE